MKIRGESILRLWDPGAIGFFGYVPGIGKASDYVTALRLARRNGHLRNSDIVHNLVVDDGLELAVDLLLGLETGLSYHAVGTDDTTAVISDTQLVSEHTRRAWAHSSRTAQTGYFSVFYLSTEVNVLIEEAGVFGGASASATADSGILFSRYLQTLDNSGGSPQDITFDWNVTVSRE